MISLPLSSPAAFLVLWVFDEWHMFYLESYFQPGSVLQGEMRPDGRGKEWHVSVEHWALSSKPAFLPGE